MAFASIAACFAAQRLNAFFGDDAGVSGNTIYYAPFGRSFQFGKVRGIEEKLHP